MGYDLTSLPTASGGTGIVPPLICQQNQEKPPLGLLIDLRGSERNGSPLYHWPAAAPLFPINRTSNSLIENGLDMKFMSRPFLHFCNKNETKLWK